MQLYQFKKDQQVRVLTHVGMNYPKVGAIVTLTSVKKDAFYFNHEGIQGYFFNGEIEPITTKELL
jgi:hypothetical protein